jgi:hypothetical protein
LRIDHRTLWRCPRLVPDYCLRNQCLTPFNC